MICPDLEAYILRLHLVEKWPPGTIAVQVGLHPQTVRRVLEKGGISHKTFRRKPRMVDPFIPFLLETLEKYPTLCASRLFAMVRERGYKGLPDHFRAIVAEIRPRPAAEAFLRLRTLPGEQAQVDWAHFGHITIDGARRPLVAFVLVLSWSRKIFLRFGCDMRMGAFLAHHVAAFEAMGGVARVNLYDNLKSAVIERIGDAIRFNENLLAFASHHHYEPRPVAVYRGNQKGRVERAIRYIRTAFFPARTWQDLDDLNDQAKAWCEGEAADRKCPGDRLLTVREAFETERPRLLPLPDDGFPVEDRVAVRVGKTPYARFDLNDYSVPHGRVRRMLTVVASQKVIRILDGQDLVATHDRSWGRGMQIEDPAHIAALVALKQKAHEGSATDRLHHTVPKVRDFLNAAAERGSNLGSIVSGLLRYLDTYGINDLETAVSEALDKGAPHLAGVRQVLERLRNEKGLPPPIAVRLSDNARARDVVVKPHRLSSYDPPKEDDNE